MRLVDANLLLYAYDVESRQHERARVWLESTLDGQGPVRFAVTTLMAFVRISSDPRVFHRPLSAESACGHVAEWLSLPDVGIAEPTPDHWSVLAQVATDGQARGPLMMDAHLAALAVEHGATLCTTDRDFRRFRGLRTLDPLSAR